MCRSGGRAGESDWNDFVKHPEVLGPCIRKVFPVLDNRLASERPVSRRALTIQTAHRSSRFECIENQVPLQPKRGVPTRWVLENVAFLTPYPPHSEMLRVVRTHRPSMVSGAASFLNFRNVLTEALTSKGDAANGEATSTADSFFPGSFPVPRAVQRRYNASFLQARKKHLVLVALSA